ncbi:hypothetical protein SFUMM280S_08541 [Streptomyces fumanus]
MARLRTALGAPKLIQTVVKRGYRLALDAAADTKYADGSTPPGVPATEPSGHCGKRTPRSRNPRR